MIRKILEFLFSFLKKPASSLPAPEPIPVPVEPAPVVNKSSPVMSSPKEEITDSVTEVPDKAIGKAFEKVSDLKRYLKKNMEGSLAWQGVVLHHSETDDDGMRSDFESIRRYHKETNKWSEIGYHFLIEVSGNKLVVKLGRPLHVAGSHCFAYNQHFIGICCVGNFDHYKPAEPIWQFCLEVTKMLMDLYNIKKNRVLGHRETYKERGVPVEKQCPGSRFDLSLFRELL